ncbi:MAG: hypothetical protein ACPGED_09960 [Flavobacteriales bacterium]
MLIRKVFSIAFLIFLSWQAKAQDDSLSYPCGNALRYGLITPNSFEECFQSLSCVYADQVAIFQRKSESTALREGFISGFERTRLPWKGHHGPELEKWFNEHEVYHNSYRNSVILLLFHRQLNKLNFDPEQAVADLKKAHETLNKEAEVYYKDELKYNKLVQKNIRKSRRSGIKELKKKEKAEVKRAKKATRSAREWSRSRS